MAGETVITVVGNLVDDPELRFTPSGAAVAKFRVASTPRTFDRQTNEWKDGESLFLTCSVWRQAAENVAESLTKGTRVIVQGRLKQRSYEDREGIKRTVYELDVDEVGASLRNATAKVTKTGRPRRPGRRLRRWRRPGRRRRQLGRRPRWPGRPGRRPRERPVGHRPGRRRPGRRRQLGRCPRRRQRWRLLGRATLLSETHRSRDMAKPPARKPKKKVCVFCKEKISYVDYKDTNLLRKFISDRGKIRARRVTGNCTQHQRDVATAVKNSREMALLPYTSTAR